MVTNARDKRAERAGPRRKVPTIVAASRSNLKAQNRERLRPAVAAPRDLALRGLPCSLL